jgi:excisionase family DNA binding protein
VERHKCPLAETWDQGLLAVAMAAIAAPMVFPGTTLAEALDVSPRTVRRWIANGDLVVTRVHGVIRVADDDLRAFLALHREA